MRAKGNGKENSDSKISFEIMFIYKYLNCFQKILNNKKDIQTVDHGYKLLNCRY